MPNGAKAIDGTFERQRTEELILSAYKAEALTNPEIPREPGDNVQALLRIVDSMVLHRIAEAEGQWRMRKFSPEPVRKRKSSPKKAKGRKHAQ